jgi:hypothetical protein
MNVYIGCFHAYRFFGAETVAGLGSLPASHEKRQAKTGVAAAIRMDVREDI